MVLETGTALPADETCVQHSSCHRRFFFIWKNLALFGVETPVNVPRNPNSPSGPWVWILVQAPSLIAGLMCVAMPFTLSVTHQLKMPL